jgi:hypothetical protein
MWKIVFIFICVPTCLFSQQKSFLSLRYNEDYSYLKKDTAKSFYRSLKYHALTKDINHSIGGEVRFQTLNYTNENWEDNGNHTEFYRRLLLHSDLKIGNSIRIFSQIVSTDAYNRLAPNRTVDENQLDLSQLFIDLSLNKGLTKVRLGRQEMPLGVQRLYSTREGLNNRLSFDLARIIFKKGTYDITAFYGYPISINKRIFDDKTNFDNKMWGLNLQKMNAFKITNLELYYLGNEYLLKKYATVSGNETRHSVGLHLWDKEKTLKYDFESVYQFGTLANQNINAYTVSLDAYYELEKFKNKQRIGFKTEIISGDKNSMDNELNTFNALFPRGAYFGLAALIGPANLVDFHPYIEFELSRKTIFGIDYDIFWRHSSQDASYDVPMNIIAFNNSNEKHIGNQLSISLDYQPNKFLLISTGSSWFQSGSFIKSLTYGKDILLFDATVQIKF